MRFHLFLVHFLLALCLSSYLSSQTTFDDCLRFANGHYTYNPNVPQDTWDQLEPYFLPFTHPAKTKLDKIFSKSRAIASFESFYSAGFKPTKDRGNYKIRIGKHPHLKGIIIKAYFDDQPIIDEWEQWIKRIRGAIAIRNYVKERKFVHFQVPRKWIYPLPNLESGSTENPAPYPKHFILVVEDMDLAKRAQKLEAYKNMNRKTMAQLFMIIRDLQLVDSVYTSNVPYTKKGKWAFIDTEHYHIPHYINYGLMTPYFSNENQSYWEDMILHNGPEMIPKGSPSP